MTHTSEPKNQGFAVVSFVRQVRDEINQITWPTREKTIKLTTIVIVVSFVVGVYLGALDFIFTKLMGYII